MNITRWVLTSILGLVYIIPVYAEKADSVTQFGITWTFDKEYEVGQFVNGDYWVVGPVMIASVSPQPGPPQIDETVRFNYIRDFINQYGDTELQNDTTMRNGSMVNPNWGPGQGYDSGSKSYNSSLSISFPYTLNPSESLISTVSHTTLPNTPLLPFYSELSRSVLKTAAILTCLDSVPPDDAFRPPYASTWKPLYRAGDLKRELLPNLEPVSRTPGIAEMEKLVERPWLDHINNWMLGGTAPTENLASYGREFCRTVSLVGLRLMLEGTEAEKEKLLLGFVQLGIDLHGLRKAGAMWHMGGGITSGRKWPVVFASLLLDDEEMKIFPGASEFHEDQQTYYGVSWTGETALWQMVKHHGTAPMYEHRNPADYSDIDYRSHSYRHCCTGLAWIGEALGALLIEARQTWNHDAFFDYCDRFMNEPTDPYREAGLSYNLLGKAFDPFVQNMWDAYRDSVPEQPGATNNMKWLTYYYTGDENAPSSTSGEHRDLHQMILSQNHPNPFHSQTNISYYVQQAGSVELSIRDMDGRKIATLVNGHRAAGHQSCHWDASSCDGGVYFCTLKTSSGYSQTIKMVLFQ
ncbi:MAG: T9SS type A sorting domain-containing protein [Bacteroidota bacterium]